MGDLETKPDAKNPGINFRNGMSKHFMVVGLPGFEPGAIGPEPTMLPSYTTDPVGS